MHGSLRAGVASGARRYTFSRPFGRRPRAFRKPSPRPRVGFVPVDLEQAREARRAFSRFGKGRHPAGLDRGDCFAYALAQVRDEPLLLKGDDFGRTDVPTLLA
ncbi:MAG: type II toxin-antitoxin system VapC family toxin [Deferrisomatales bacterium]